MSGKMPERRIEYVPLAEIREAARNPKAHADAELQQSIDRFGYVEPMVWDERTGRLVAGHGRLSALRVAKEAGQAAPKGIRKKGAEWLVPVLRGWASRSDMEADAYLLASNQLTIAGGWDELELATLLKELESGGAIEGLGFNDAQIAQILTALETAAPLERGAEWDGLTDFENEPDGSRFRITVHFTSEENLRDFFAKLEIPVPGRRYMWWPNDEGAIRSDVTKQYVAAES